MTARIEVAALQGTLKRLIFARGLHYEDLAAHLGVSLSTAKRVLNGEDLSFDRVLTLCDWLGIGLRELIEMAETPGMDYHFISEDQELFLAQNLGHLAYLVRLQGNQTPEQIERESGISKQDTETYLNDLAAHGFLKRGRDLAISLVVKDGMDWRKDGPLRRAFMGRLLQGLLDHYLGRDEHGKESFIDFGHKILTEESYRELKRELDDLSRKYGALSRLEPRIHGRQKVKNYTYVMLFDEWKSPMWDITSPSS